MGAESQEAFLNFNSKCNINLSQKENPEKCASFGFYAGGFLCYNKKEVRDGCG